MTPTTVIARVLLDVVELGRPADPALVDELRVVASGANEPDARVAQALDDQAAAGGPVSEPEADPAGLDRLTQLLDQARADAYAQALADVDALGDGVVTVDAENVPAHLAPARTHLPNIDSGDAAQES